MAVIEKPEEIPGATARLDSSQVVLVPRLPANPDYGALKLLAGQIGAHCGEMPVYVALEQDLAKALGHCLELVLPPGRPCLCIDGVSLAEGNYLDVGKPVGSCFPVVIKTIVFEK